MEKRFIKIKVTSYKWSNGDVIKTDDTPEEFLRLWHPSITHVKEVTLQITAQSHRCEEFNPKANGETSKFISSNKFELCSRYTPAMGIHNPRTLFVRGSYSVEDDNSVTVSYGNFKEIVKAIEEYNELYENKEEEEKVKEHLKIEILGNNEKFTAFYIKEQIGRGDSFKKFKASNGVKIESVITPCWDNRGCLFVRGASKNADFDIIHVPNNDMPNILEAIKEYNASFSKEKLLVSLEEVKSSFKEFERTVGAFKILAHEHDECFCGSFNIIDGVESTINTIEEHLKD